MKKTLNRLALLQFVRREQIWGWMQDWFFMSKPDLSPAPSLRPKTGHWQEPIRPRPTLLAPQAFRFLQQTHEINLPTDWNHPDRPRLWLNHLHEFSDLVARQANSRRGWHHGMLSRWMQENPPGFGIGWEPHPLSLRMVHWIQWSVDGGNQVPGMLDSLAVQTRWLRHRLEWRLSGTRLFANAKAMVYAGVFFQGDEAEAWLAQGLAILQREIAEQILADGGHFERSPMLHAGVLEDLLDLLNLAWAFPDAPIPAQMTANWRETASRMLFWLRLMCHPDGGIGFFNDAALDGAPDWRELAAYAKRLKTFPLLSPMPEGTVCLKSSGYVRMTRGQAVVLLDVAPMGPVYLPDHAHADILSFEFSLLNQRILVNSGTCHLDDGPLRQLQRGTAAKTTITLRNENSSPLDGGWQVVRRARPIGYKSEEKGESLYVECAHDGYQRLFNRVLHWRQWRLQEGELIVCDRISGRFQEGVARYYLHPAIRAKADEAGRTGSLSLPNGQLLTWEIEGGIGQLVVATHHPRLGLSLSTRCLEIPLQGPELKVVFRW